MNQSCSIITRAKHRLTGNQRLLSYLLGAAVGVVSGLVAVGFRYLIFGMGLMFVIIPQILGVWGWILIPAIGGILVGAITVRYAPEAKGHGVPEVIEAYHLHSGEMRLRVPLLKALASSICIGSGGSCGREGPIAQIGAGVGSSMASVLKLGKTGTKTLVICGMSSGIAATFNAPLGGTLFGIEVVAGGVLGYSIIPVILSSVVATAVVGILLGPSISFHAPQFVLATYPELVLYLILGILLGLLSVIWMRGFYLIEDQFEKIRTSPYALPVLGGLMTGILAFLALWVENISSYSGVYDSTDLFYPAIMGVGYPFIDAALIGQASLLALLVFGVLKIFATSFTLGSGGSGGVFAPTLFIGAALGGAFGQVFNIVFPGSVPNPMAYVLVGMAALFAGTGRAPITCIVIIMEMTLDYAMILPLMIAVSTAFFVSSSIEEDSIYTLKLSRRGTQLGKGFYIGALKAVKISEIMTKSPTILSPTMTVSEVYDIMTESTHTKFPVVDESGHALGCLVVEDIKKQRKEDGTLLLVKDLMNTSFLKLDPECSVDSVLHAMMERDEGHAVVVDPQDPSLMVGFVSKTDVLRAYEVAILNLRKEGNEIEEIEILEELGS
ncbi:MAG: chloride channel protein [Candidatus Thorarchaeota archaeon]